MKRFTDTDKWRDPWFRKLSSPAKQLWLYLCDHCDMAGMVEIDYQLATIDCGQEITEKHLQELGDRVISSPNTPKLLIPKFVHFQFGELSNTCPPHRSIIKLVESYGLVRVGLEYRYPNDTLRVGKHYPQEKEKDKDKEKEEGDARGRFKPPTCARRFCMEQNQVFPNRRFRSSWRSTSRRVGMLGRTR